MPLLRPLWAAIPSRVSSKASRGKLLKRGS